MKNWKLEKPIKFQRLCERYSVDLVGEIEFCENVAIPVRVGEVSKTGFLLRTTGNVPQGFLKLRIKSPDGFWMNLSAERVWQKPTGEQGFRITTPCDEWDRYIAHLEETAEPLKFAA